MWLFADGWGLEDSLALEVLSENLKVGDTIRVEAGPEGLTFTPVM